MDPAARRLLFWLRVPFVADVFLVVIAIVLFAQGTPTAAWVVLAFTGVRFAANAVALWILTPRILRRTQPVPETTEFVPEATPPVPEAQASEAAPRGNALSDADRQPPSPAGG